MWRHPVVETTVQLTTLLCRPFLQVKHTQHRVAHWLLGDAYLCVCVCVCVCVCARARLRASACVRACVCVLCVYMCVRACVRASV